MQADPDKNAAPRKGKKSWAEPLFYILPPLIVGALLMFVWTTKSPSAKPADSTKTIAKADTPAKPVAETPSAPADATPVAYDTVDDTLDDETDVPSLLDDDAVGEEIEEIPADTTDDGEEEDEGDDTADDTTDTPAEDAE